jgi:hypothetical protein
VNADVEEVTENRGLADSIVDDVEVVTGNHDGVHVLGMADIESTYEPNPIIADFDDDDPNGAHTKVSADKDGIMYRVLITKGL